VVLVDSSIWIDLLRQGEDPAQAMAPHAERHDLAICGVVRAEVLRGMREPRTRQALAGYFNCLLYIPTLNKVWERTEEILWQGDRLGRVIPLSDAIIAACALQADGVVLTRDAHFSTIPNLRVWRTFPE
jgi:predicted nucleic acid-binding protein